MDSTKRERVSDKLDNAFLFILSSVGVLFAIIQVYQERSALAFLEISPLLFMGMVLPFYIGYFRGSIEMDNIIERIRGWIYLVTGTSTYLAFYLSNYIIILSSAYIITLLREWFHVIDPTNQIIIIIWINALLFSALVFLGFFLIYCLLKWFNKVFGLGELISNQYAFSGTMISSILLVFAFRMIVSLYSDLIHVGKYSTLVMWFIWWIPFALLISFAFEKTSKNIVGFVPNLTNLQIRTRRRLNKFVRGIILGYDLFSFAIYSDPKLFFFFFEGFAFWTIGSITMIAKVPLFSDIFLFLAIFFTIFGIFSYRSFRKFDFSGFESSLFPMKIGEGVRNGNNNATSS